MRSTMTEPELLAFSLEHVRYEINMFFTTADLLSGIVGPLADDASIASKNALLESFVIHLRNLLLFLYPKSPDEDEVVADDFFIDPVTEWKRKRPKITRALEEARTRAHQEVSHLTTGRGINHQWAFPLLIQEMKVVLQIFVDHASPNRLHPDVKALVTSIDPLNFRRTVTDPSTTQPSTAKVIVGGFAGATNSLTFVSSSFPEDYKIAKK